MKKNVTLICDLQFGSTGKGLIAGYLAERDQPDVVVTAWSPNAGHTYINEKGEEFIHTMLANGIVSPCLKSVLIGPGSVVNLDSLVSEVRAARQLGYLENITILIHPHAAIVAQHHRDEEERTMTGIGSTKKGSGAALTQKIQRQVDGCVVARDVLGTGIDGMIDVDGCIIRVAGFDQYNAIIDQAQRIHVEGAQGFSLGINSGFYPYTTSRECTPAQLMTDCGVPMGKLRKVVGCMRTYPIRVANRFDESGNQIGYSGPGYRDQDELEWDQLGIEPELTTVTKLPRRIFSFSMEQARQSIRMCRPDEIFLNFCNYVEDAEALMQEWVGAINVIDREVRGFRSGDVSHSVVRYLGEGPEVTSVYDLELERLRWWNHRADTEAASNGPV